MTAPWEEPYWNTAAEPPGDLLIRPELLASIEGDAEGTAEVCVDPSGGASASDPDHPPPPVPDWLFATRHRDVTIHRRGWPSRTRQIRVYRFPLLGHGYAGHDGVGLFMLQKLYDAQLLVWDAFVRQSGGAAAVEALADAQGAFRAWCQVEPYDIGWIGQREDTANHGDGSATDLNYYTCPWIPARRDNHITGDSSVTPARREAAVAVYDRATWLHVGGDEPAPIYPASGDDPASVSSAFYELKRIEYRMRAYFYYLYGGPVATKHLEMPGHSGADYEEHDTSLQTSDAVRARLAAAVAAGFIAPEGVAHTAAGAFPVAELLDASAPAALDAFIAQVVSDHDAFRWAIPAGDGAHDFKSRDPCRGFLSLRAETVEACAAAGLRWGFGDGFGGDAGDIMHFDTVGHAEAPDIFIGAMAEELLTLVDDSSAEKAALRHVLEKAREFADDLAATMSAAPPPEATGVRVCPTPAQIRPRREAIEHADLRAALKAAMKSVKKFLDDPSTAMPWSDLTHRINAHLPASYRTD